VESESNIPGMGTRTTTAVLVLGQTRRIDEYWM